MVGQVHKPPSLQYLALVPQTGPGLGDTLQASRTCSASSAILVLLKSINGIDIFVDETTLVKVSIVVVSLKWLIRGMMILSEVPYQG